LIEIHTYPGERVGADGILELGRTDEMVAIAEVYETDIGRVRKGQRARRIGDSSGLSRSDNARSDNLQGDLS
jgi:HlyD family secretion protein